MLKKNHISGSAGFETGSMSNSLRAKAGLVIKAKLGQTHLSLHMMVAKTNRSLI